MATDIKLLGYVAAALFFSMAIMLLLTLRQALRVRGATQWVWSTLTVAIGIGLNTTSSSATVFRHHRHQRDDHRGHAWLMLAGSKLRPNAAGVVHRRFRPPHGMMVLGLLMMVAVFGIRAIDTLLNMQSAIPFGGPTRTTFIFYAVGLAGRLCLLIGMVLVLIDELAHQLRTLASRDALTGLLNRHRLTDAAHQQSLADCCLLMLDLDQFKAVNDDFGHDQSDLAIALLARCAQTNLPTNAVLARLGGEEFCALLPRTDIKAAAANAELLRAAFHRDSSTLGHTRQHKVRIGGASAQSAATTLSQLMTRADQALYRAKRDGRNRVQMAGAD